MIILFRKNDTRKLYISFHEPIAIRVNSVEFVVGTKPAGKDIILSMELISCCPLVSDC